MTESQTKLNPALGILIAICAWAVPGLGHALLRRWGRAITFFSVTAALAAIGYWLHGEVFTARSNDTFGTLGFLADAGAGAFYFLLRAVPSAGPDISRATGDYGSRFLAAAGIVNLLGMLDAYATARARRD